MGLFMRLSIWLQGSGAFKALCKVLSSNYFSKSNYFRVQLEDHRLKATNVDPNS